MSTPEHETSPEPRSFPSSIPFLDDLGVEFLGMGNGEAQVALTLESRHMNSWQVAHGGLSMTMLDVAMAMAGRSHAPDLQASVTVEMKTSFMQAGGQPGDRIVARGKVLHRSTSMSFCEGELWNGDQLVAKAMGTFKFLRRADAGKRAARKS